MLQTFQTKLSNIQLNPECSSDQYLIEYGDFFGRLERKLFVQSHIKGIPSSNLKKTFLTHYGITSRQFNSIRIQLDGKVSSFLEKRDLDIQDLEAKTAYLQKIIHQKTKQKAKFHQKLLLIPQTDPLFPQHVKKYKNLKHYLHQKKRRLRNLQQRLEKLKVDRDTKKIRICFGSKKLFHRQFHLSENEYKSHNSGRKIGLRPEVPNFLS